MPTPGESNYLKSCRADETEINQTLLELRIPASPKPTLSAALANSN